MKLSTILVLLFTLNLHAETYSQKITIGEKNISLKQVFLMIEKQAGVSFVYEEKVLEHAAPITLNVKNASLTDVLNICLNEQNYSYEIVHNTVIVRSKQPKVSKAGANISEARLIEVTGTVTNSGGEPLAGVTVSVKNENNSAITNEKGQYSITVPGSQSVLVFTYIGFAPQEIAVHQSAVIDIQLEEQTMEMDQIVVVGYGTVKKSDLTGSVSSIKEKDLQSRPVPSVGEAMQGRMGGVQIRETGGELNGRYQFSIRGTGSVTGSNDPLVVIDGVPVFSNDLSTINPADIVSVDVLKDASASAIYGARAANGVVIINTRRGSSGKPSLNVSVDQGVDYIARRYKVLSTEEQRLLFVEAFKNTNRNTDAYENLSDPAWQIDTDWQKLGTRTGMRQGYNMSVSGGSEKSKYAISGAYKNRKGIMKNTDLDQFLIRANNDISIGKLKLTSNVSGTYLQQHILRNDSWGSGAYQRLVSSHSYLPPYDENGQLFAVSSAADPYFGENSNPLIEQFLPTNKRENVRMLSNFKADYALNRFISASANVGADIEFTRGSNYLPVYSIGRYSRPQGSLTENSQRSINWIAEYTLEYKNKWHDHAIAVLGGYSVQNFKIETTSIIGNGTVDNSLSLLSNQTAFNASGTSINAGLTSYFARANYAYMDRYLLTATVRRDGSSKFGPSKRYGTFPSVSFAWKLSNEKFLEHSFTGDLKMRAGYGLTGNQNIGDFAFISRAAATPYVWGNSVVVGNSPQNLGNSQLQWESARQLNIGVDFSLFNNRFFITADYYNKRSNDLLIQRPVAYTAAVLENPFVNLGVIENKGVEFSVNSVNTTGSLKWNSNLNFTYNKNKVLDIGTNSQGTPLQIQGETISLPNDFANLTQAGYPVGSFYMYRFIGIWQQHESAEAAANGAVPGDPRFEDLNKNQTLDGGDKSFMGSPLPKFFGGVTNSLDWRNWSLNILFTFSGGNKLYNAMRNLNARAVPFNQQLAEVADFWTPDNPSNTIPRPSQGGNTTFLATRVSSKYLEDASFIRLKNIGISYRLPKTYFSSVFNQAVITANATNLVTFTKYSGLDPEAQSTSSLLSGGIDYTPYPLTRYFSVTINVGF